MVQPMSFFSIFTVAVTASSCGGWPAPLSWKDRAIAKQPA